MIHTRDLSVITPGRIRYAEGLKLQADLVKKRRADDIDDTLVVLEHPHVITLGSSSDIAHILVDDEERARRGIDLHKAGRGGDVTYHGPGQLVVYPILDLKPHRRDLHQYMRDLEAVLIGTAADYGIEAERDEAGTGVWTKDGKLAAIGIRVSSGWITSHGIALNVDTELRYFDTIVPCGIPDRAVTSLERELGFAPSLSEVSKTLIRNFCRVFGYRSHAGELASP
ncbi:MAG TPA: lipoyl(octanoyl) transferase [Gemmatimonadetes bacterium]|nr:lipoyl(octanoyl) transferase [Gemmatimonadota bacterium]HBV06482.1 lipoyl(octanoyl) transferase [Gemmatimonadota bacterium]HCO13705.1 lipoyl(octanoyl) transferase [Gemmatimonadota bacterium]|tara:strand:+ start:9915 stop:10592 length:678 start_codon:yes stop_codon:yes gene_type:complete